MSTPITDEEIFLPTSAESCRLSSSPAGDPARPVHRLHPGVAQVSRARSPQPELVDKYTWTNRLVVVVSDGTAVLGLGDIGPRASLPVMEASPHCSAASPG